MGRYPPVASCLLLRLGDLGAFAVSLRGLRLPDLTILHASRPVMLQFRIIPAQFFLGCGLVVAELFLVGVGPGLSQSAPSLQCPTADVLTKPVVANHRST
jgi:hypothetical protein